MAFARVQIAQTSPVTRAAELVASYGLTAIVLSLPFEFTADYLKLQLVRWVAVFVGLAYLYLLGIGRRQLVLPRIASVGWLLAFIAVAIVSWMTTRAPGATSHVLDIVLYPAMALLIANLAMNEEDHRRAWSALLVSGLVISILGAALYVANVHIWMPNPKLGERQNITFADPNITARFLTLTACAAVFMYSARQGPRWLTVGTALACALVLPVTFSRSGMALLPLMLLLVIVVAQNHRRAAAIGLAAFLAFAISTGVNPDSRQRAADGAMYVVSLVTGTSHTLVVSGTQGTHAVTPDDNRKYLIAAGIRMFKDHPLTGVGFGGYQHALLTTYNWFLPPKYTDSVSHTTIVTVLAELGIIGAILIVGFLLTLAREGWRARRRGDSTTLWAVMPITLVVPILLFSQFEGRLFEEPYLWLALGLAYSGHVLAAHQRVREREPKRRAQLDVAGERRATKRRRLEVA